MSRNILLLTFLAIIMMIVGCESKSNIGKPREFFSKNKIGDSADYAVIKWGNPDDHVITVHGFMDDLKSCLLITEALNKDACNETGGNNVSANFTTHSLSDKNLVNS